ncbi:MAG: DUF6600 domain-containing protein [Gallionella sp.]
MLGVIKFITSLLLVSILNSSVAHAQNETASAGFTPMRLSYVDGDASYWRNGSENWVPAELNTPVALGDALYVGADGDVELQLGNRAFIRADDETQFGLVNQTQDFIQFKITAGRVSFDLRAIRPGYMLEVDTPNSVFNIDRAGYYRVDVNGDVRFTTRRGGSAVVTPAGGQTMSINPSEEIVVQGTDLAQAEAYVVSPPDTWDQWNFERSDGLIDVISERYMPRGIAGASDLDHYGNWRIVPDYGPVWMPDGVSFDWTPYSAGRWVWDAYYQWTWIDDEPWGWAPFHYGRWVNIGGYWAWAPGPATANPVYSPALVAFFDVEAGTPGYAGKQGVAWVALSWGEPVIPWWGRTGFIGRPWWGGWDGPREQHDEYRNARISHSLVATSRDDFGNRHEHEVDVRNTRPRQLERVNGALPIRRGGLGPIADYRRDNLPAERVMTGAPDATSSLRGALRARQEGTRQVENSGALERRPVLVPRRTDNVLRHPEFGTQTGEERLRAALPPRYAERRHILVTDEAKNPKLEQSIKAREPQTVTLSPPEKMAPIVGRETGAQQHGHQDRRILQRPDGKEKSADSAPTSAGIAAPAPTPKELPGKAANRVYRTGDKDKDKERRQHADRN